MKVVKVSCIFLLPMICHAVLAQTQNISVVDDNGSTIVLEQPARRIISLAPHITELLFAVGAGDRLVGAMEFSDYPEPAKQIERVGNHNSIDLERISVLQPDLIFAWKSGNPSAAINKLQQLGFTVFQSEPKSLMDIVSSMQRFSQLTATQQKANKAIEKFQREYQRLQQRYDNKKQVTVFYEIWNKPMMTVNGQHRS